MANVKEKIQVWKNVFDADENSISKSLSNLSWNVAAFSCVVEMVRQAPDDKLSGKRLNGMVLDLLVSGFWSSTMLAIRRLVDKSQPLYGKNAVCSLGALIADAKSVRPLLTRRVYVEDIANLSYNYEVVRKKYWDFFFEQEANQAFWTPREFHYMPSESRHTEFDWLSGVSQGGSSDEDLIQESIFHRLESRLERLSGVVEHATLNFAHAATDASRRGRVLERWGLDDAKSAIKEVAQIAEFTGRWFCYKSIGTVLPTPQFNQFENLEIPFFQGDLDSLQKVWEDFSADAEGWHAVENDEL